jgi:hypothetical protein
LKDILNNSKLRKEFLGGATDSKKAVKAFLQENAGNALKTRPKVCLFPFRHSISCPNLSTRQMAGTAPSRIDWELLSRAEMRPSPILSIVLTEISATPELSCRPILLRCVKMLYSPRYCLSCRGEGDSVKDDAFIGERPWFGCLDLDEMSFS